MADAPVEAVPAATILLLREREALEVFMVVRHHQIDFASGALVFPGGKTDPQDFDDALIPLLEGPSSDKNVRAMQVSAIREAFEECGILLAYDEARESEATGADGQNRMIGAARLRELKDFRDKLNRGEVSLRDFLEQHSLRLACDQLTHFAHWITPEMMPKRFDTHFYLAVAPEDHLAIHDGYESVDSVWIQPADAIEDARAGKRTVIFPTLRNIEKLGESRTIEGALAAARSNPVVPVLPWTEQRDDGNYLCIPVEAGYAVSEEKTPERRTP